MEDSDQINTTYLPSGKIPDAVFMPQDQRICEEILRSATRQKDKDKPISELLVSTALHFIGTPYESETIEKGGPEPLVVNMRAFDCATLSKQLSRRL